MLLVNHLNLLLILLLDSDYVTLLNLILSSIYKLYFYKLGTHVWFIVNVTHQLVVELSYIFEH